MVAVDTSVRFRVLFGAALLGGFLAAGCDQQGPSPARDEARTSDRDSTAIFVNSIGVEFRRIPAGTFEMGSSAGEEDEQPVHEVEITEPFYLGSGEVTQAQWETLMDENPSRFQGPFRPVEGVSWNRVQEFIRRLNDKEDTDLYRLPTEAEWEYAARGGNQTRFYFGETRDSLGIHAWFSANSESRTHRTEQKKTNPFGLHDVYGNVWEWTRDAYDPLFYRRSARENPANPVDGQAPRVIRGGGWFSVSSTLRSANRGWARPGSGSPQLGFRLVREIPAGEQ